MSGVFWRHKKLIDWSPPQSGEMKFNVDGASRGKPGPIGIGGVLRDHLSHFSWVFSESVGIRDSNKAKLLSIRRALNISVGLGGGKLVIERDSANAIKWSMTRSIFSQFWTYLSILNSNIQ